MAEARGIGTMQEKTGSASSDNNLFEVVIEYDDKAKGLLRSLGIQRIKK